MREHRRLARVGRGLFGERYGALRLLAFRLEQRVRREQNRDQFSKAFAAAAGTFVQRGPFAGMHFFRAVPGPTTVVPMLLGSYEEELHSVIEAEIARGPSLVVDVGSAEGYYAVGLARRLPASRIVAFEIDPMARYMCRRLARMNGVSDRVEVRGECSTEDLATVPPGSLVVSDCEGAEKRLLDPEAAPGLRGAHIVVEVHDAVDPTITETLTARFLHSHVVERISTQPRDPGLYPELASLTRAEALKAVSEDRGRPMTWLVMRPRARG